MRDGSLADGQSGAFTINAIGARINISAVFEPTIPVSVASPVAPPTGLQAAALKKCKKKARKLGWSHTKLKKCKKRALLLPV